jgi:hypothetical protein
VAAPDDPYDWFLLAYDLHRRRRAAPAEVAYRRAIEGGFTDAWLYLGVLLSGRRGRREDEMTAYRAAMSSDDPELASRAALWLGLQRDKLDGDLPAARSCYELARDRGTGVVKQSATMNLGLLLAYQGDREAAESALRSFVEERTVRLVGEPVLSADTAGRIARIAHGKWTRSGVRGLRVTLFRLWQPFSRLITRFVNPLPSP